MPIYYAMCVCVCVCVCPHPKGIQITSGTIYTVCDWLNLFYSHDTIAINKVDGQGNDLCKLYTTGERSSFV